MRRLENPPKDGTHVLIELEESWAIVWWDGEDWYDNDYGSVREDNILAFWSLPTRTAGPPAKTPLPSPPPGAPPGPAFDVLDRVGDFAVRYLPRAAEPVEPAPPSSGGVGEEHVMLFGKYKGQTLARILDKNPGYIVWLDTEEALGIRPELVKRAESRQLRMRASRNYYSYSSYTDHTREYTAAELKRMLHDEREDRRRDEDRRRVDEEMYRINGPDCPPGISMGM